MSIFLPTTVPPLIAILASTGGLHGQASATPPPARTEQVVVVFKTHFDIGYTDMASNVVHRYQTTAHVRL